MAFCLALDTYLGLAQSHFLSEKFRILPFFFFFFGNVVGILSPHVSLIARLFVRSFVAVFVVVIFVVVVFVVVDVVFVVVDVGVMRR